MMPKKINSYLLIYSIGGAFSGILLDARPSFVLHGNHLHIVHFSTQEKPAPNQNNKPQGAVHSQLLAQTSPEPLNEEDRPFLQALQTAFTPLLAHYSFEKIIPQDPQTTSFEEQLEYMHLIATFVSRLSAKHEGLSPKLKEFMMTPFAKGQPLMQLITKTLVCLQSYCAERLAAYKTAKAPAALLKELKKLTSATAKELDLLCQKILQLPSHEI